MRVHPFPSMVDCTTAELNGDPRISGERPFPRCSRSREVPPIGSPPMVPAVEAEQLVKHYAGRGGKIEAVRGVDLRVASGEVFGFLGPNGAGKSTTVRMLTTLLTITSGSARVAGVDVAADPDEARRRIGVALQEAGLDPRQTGRELLVLQARLFGSTRGRGAATSGGAARARRSRRLRRSTHQGLLGWDEAPARPCVRARAPARGALPRRADDRARSREPVDGVGGGPADQPARDDGVPHDPVPRGSRSALRSAGHHRRREDRRARARRIR